MNRTTTTLVIAAMLAGACTLQAQDANPLSKNMKDSWTNIRDLLTKMADKMPAKPIQGDAGGAGLRAADGHAVQFMMRGCATANGEQKAVTLLPMPSKPEVLAAMKDAALERDMVFSGLN